MPRIINLKQSRIIAFWALSLSKKKWIEITCRIQASVEIQSSANLMLHFLLLDDVSQFSARRSNERVEGQMMTSEGSEETSQLFQISPPWPRTPEQPQRDVKQVEELEIEVRMIKVYLHGLLYILQNTLFYLQGVFHRD